jgi:hypothetical protein
MPERRGRAETCGTGADNGDIDGGWQGHGELANGE